MRKITPYLLAIAMAMPSAGARAQVATPGLPLVFKGWNNNAHADQPRNYGDWVYRNVGLRS